MSASVVPGCGMRSTIASPTQRTSGGRGERVEGAEPVSCAVGMASFQFCLAGQGPAVSRSLRSVRTRGHSGLMAGLAPWSARLANRLSGDALFTGPDALADLAGSLRLSRAQVGVCQGP